MVQFFAGKERYPKSNLGEILGQSLGQGLSSFMTDYYANKSIDQAMENPELQDAPLSKKWEALQRSTRGFGERGDQLLQQRLQMEQQQQQEQMQDAVSKYMKGEKLTAKEESRVPYQIKEAREKLNLEKLEKENKRLKEIEENRALLTERYGDEKSPEEIEKLAQVLTPSSAKSLKPEKPPISERSIPADQQQIISNVRSQPGFNDLSALEQYRKLTDAGVSSKLAEAESKLSLEEQKKGTDEFIKSFERHKDFINDATTRYQGFETDMKPRLLQMQSIPAENLIGPTAAKFLESLGIPLGALDDPSSELYQKLSQDLLKGLPETYGNRILKVEVDNFLKTIPTLLNSADGRRMIASNMLKLGEMKEVFYNEMRREQRQYIDQNKPLPIDFQQRILDNVLPQLSKLNQEFVKISSIKDVPEGTIPYFNPQGGITFVPNTPEDIEFVETNGGKRIW